MSEAATVIFSRHHNRLLPRSLPSLLSQCSSINQLKQLHSHLTVHGLIGDALVLAALIAISSLSLADLPYARALFHHSPSPNRFIYNTLIRAYSNSPHPRDAALLHRRMLRWGILPNAFTLPFVLKSCALESSLVESQSIHSLVLKLGFSSQVFVMNSLLHAYNACGLTGLARKVFDEIPRKTVVSWNSMIGGYSRFGEFGEVLGLFGMMREKGLVLDEFTLASLLSASSQMGSLELGRNLHWYIEVNGAGVDLTVSNALLDMYGKCGELDSARICFERMPLRNVISWTSMVCAYAKEGMIDAARCWFDEMPERSIVSWNAMISCYVQCGRCRESLMLYDRMRASGWVPDEVTLVNVLSACSQVGDLVVGKKTHEYIGENVSNPSVTLFNSVIDMYAKCGLLEVTLQLFSSMPKKNVVSWNVIIGALAMHGLALDAVDFFRNMVDEGFSPDGITFVGLLCACSHGGLEDIGEYYFEAMSLVYDVPYEIHHYACMVDVFGRGGCFGKAVELIRSMSMKPDIVVWGALLGACRIHGNARIGDQVMKQLLELEPNGGLYVLLSNLYCGTHRWEEMKRLRKLMKGRGIKKDTATSLIEIDGNVHEFLVEDTRHENSSDIFTLLDQLIMHSGPHVDTVQVDQNV